MRCKRCLAIDFLCIFYHFLTFHSPQPHCITRKQHRKNYDEHSQKLFLNELNKNDRSSNDSREERDACSFNGFRKLPPFAHSTVLSLLNNTRKQHRNHFDGHLSQMQFLNELNKSAGSSDYSREERDACPFN
ncbi:hypothetical protein AVEN_18672-1 [Araneus ventricosus]|uniref:Uncharacterized protein n=1 Tax=Araneus ventricosus TaxID=182803 RepID=A0A4Y2TNZ3_ARAVE|nr:hypothetical protein AVEN_18672-1 [Araneus ventricosus]